MREWRTTFVCVIIEEKSSIYRYNIVTHKGYKSNI